MAPLNCPRCSARLHDEHRDGLRMYACQDCGGHAINTAQLRTRLPEGVFGKLWQAARAAETGAAGCAVCGTGMRVVMVGAVEVDVCLGCQMLWLDAGEQDKLGVAAQQRATTVDQAAADQAAAVLLAEAEAASRAQRSRKKRKSERGWWLLVLVEELVWWAL